MMMDKSAVSRLIGVAAVAAIASTTLWLPEYYLGILIKTSHLYCPSARVEYRWWNWRPAVARS